MAKSNEMVPIKSYKVMTMDPEQVRELVQENLGGGFGPFDLPTITVPTGGGAFWQVPSPDGPMPAKEVVGIIAYQQVARTYYARGLDEGGDKGPPDCHSYDLVQGIGDPGIECAVCPNAQFGSAKGGERRGQACKVNRILVMLRPDSLLPVLVRVPPTSLGNLSSYLMNLTDAGVLYNQVATKLELERVVKSGFDVALIKASKAADLTPEEIARVQPLKEQFKTLFAQQQAVGARAA